MNDTLTNSTSQVSEKFVWRRLEEPLRMFGRDMPDYTWLVILGVVLSVALFYVIWMYIKDAKGVGPVWATLLGALRVSVYAILAVVFLLPARQRSTTTSTEARVVVVFDVSGSLHTSDQQPTGSPNEELETRMDRVVAMLMQKNGGFVADLLKKNPVAMYRLGSRLDNSRLVLNGEGMKLASTEAAGRDEGKAQLLLEKPPLSERFWDLWLMRPKKRLTPGEEEAISERLKVSATRTSYELAEKAIESAENDLERKQRQQERDKRRKELQDAEESARKVQGKAGPKSAWVWELAEADLARSAAVRLHEVNEKSDKDKLPGGTNLGDSLLGVLNREGGNRLQGIVVITDGRNTEGTPTAMRDLEARAKAGKVPLFVVGVGQDRRKVKIEIVDLRVPPVIQPEDKFRVATEITGEGLAGEKLAVALELTHTKPKKVAAPPVKEKDKEKDKGKPAGKEKEKEKPAGKDKDKEDKTKTGAKDAEEELEIELIEREDEKNPKSLKDRERIRLGKKIVLRPPGKSELDKSNPPRLDIEWQLDAEALAAAASPAIDLKDAKYRDKKWELMETVEDAEYKFRVVVPADKRELKKEPHQTDKVGMKVIKKPVRVLLLASAANRDYQFVRTMLVREMEKKRLELAIHLQLPPGVLQYRPGVVQDVPPERLLTEFPKDYNKARGDLLDLSSYDVIVAFDADWKRLSPEQIKLINSWSIKGGGLVMIGGHINTVDLVKESEEKERYKPLLDLLPVVLDDRRDFIERKTDEPWALDFKDASPDTDFLRLDENPEAVFAADWMNFFYGEDAKDRTKAIRGFYNLYPIKRVIPGSTILARYTDPELRMKTDNTPQPYMVANAETLTGGRVIWIGSAETWRLREYKVDYHERFWTKLVKYAAAKSKGAVVRPIRMELGKQYQQNRYVEVVAKIDGPDGQPLTRTAKPEITLKMPPGVDAKEIKQPVMMSPRPGGSNGWFSARFQVKSPGDYQLTLRVPRQPGMEGDQSESAKFSVKESNPEQDNTRPDFDLMYRMASEADDVLRRMAEADRNELRRRLERPKVPADAEVKRDPLPDKLRLYFDLGNAPLIPTCMVSDPQTTTSKGGHTDLWDDGVTVWTREPKPGQSEPEPVKVSYVLLLVVGLLSAEWLTRKLLRLA